MSFTKIISSFKLRRFKFSFFRMEHPFGIAVTCFNIDRLPGCCTHGETARQVVGMAKKSLRSRESVNSFVFVSG